MADKPILFQKDMVRATLEFRFEGRKTQTRRILNPQPPSDHVSSWVDYLGFVTGPHGTKGEIRHKLRINLGDRLYVREAWRAEHCYDGIPPRDMATGCPVFYEADSSEELKSNLGRFRQGMHMPEWASRITLIVSKVRVERLTDISQIDAIAEGIARAGWFNGAPLYQDYLNPDITEGMIDPRKSFQSLWDSINADRGFAWDQNPWVAAYTFTPIFKNILEVKDDG